MKNDQTTSSAESVAMCNDGYRFENVSLVTMLHDLRFKKGMPAAGDRIPEFNLTSTTGERINWHAFGGKPVVLTVGSLTCPETLSAMPSLMRLYEDFGSEVEFVMVNVREAHPGELICQPQTFEKKVEHAQALKKQLKIPWTVVSDDLDGNFHRLLDTKPNSAYIVDGDGVIAYRSLFANDAQNLHDALSAVVASRDLAKKESQALIGPLVKGIGYFREAFNLAGPKATRDMWLAAPPFVVAGLVADRFSSLAREKRGAAALALLSAVLVGGLASLLFLLR